MPDDLIFLLDAYSSSMILSIAAFHGVAPKGPKLKGPIIAALAKILPERGRVQQQWQELGKAERGLMEGILRRDSQASVRSLREELARQGLVDKELEPTVGVYRSARPAADPHAEKSRRFGDILARLMLRGLVFAAIDPVNSYLEVRGYELPRHDFSRLPSAVVIPTSIRRHLPALPPLLEPSVRPVKVAASRKSSARVFQRDLYLYWSYVRDHLVHMTQKDEVQKADLKKINARLQVRETLGKGEGELDYPRLRFVRQVLLALNLLVISDASLLKAETAPNDFFALPPAERVKRSFEAWQQNIYFNELLLLPRAIRPARVDETLLSAPELVVSARQAVVKAVQTLAGKVEAGDWLAFDALCDYMRTENYEFLFFRLPPRTGYYALMPQHPYTAAANLLHLEFPGVHSDAAGWDIVEAGFIRAVVAGSLCWLGLAEEGWGKEDRRDHAADAFHLTPLGAWVLGLGPCPTIPSEGGRVIVQPNMHIVALDPVNDATLAVLDCFAERLTAERAVEYQLTRASVYAGQQAGWGVGRIKAFLLEQTGVNLPGNVARTLDEWQAQHERLVFHPKVALAHGPAQLLDAVAETTPAGGLVAGRPLPEVLLLKNSKAVPGLVAALRAQSILPLVTERAAVPAKTVQAEINGTLRFTVRCPSLYLHGHLAAFADPDDKGGYQVTAETVARAARAGLSAPEIVARLAAVHRGPVPEKLAQRIRAWAKHYGDAALEEVLLLQVRDAATLAELRADPELAPLLQDFAPATDKALACVRPADEEVLRARLAERGISLGERLG
jgi:hypothetical protein